MCGVLCVNGFLCRTVEGIRYSELELHVVVKFPDNHNIVHRLFFFQIIISYLLFSSQTLEVLSLYSSHLITLLTLFTERFKK